MANKITIKIIFILMLCMLIAMNCSINNVYSASEEEELIQLLTEYKVPLYYNNINNEINANKLVNVKEQEYNIKDFNFKVIYTKGHRNDLVTYYFYEDNIMFTGDFLFKESIGRTDLEYADVNEMKNSINKIKQYDDDIKIYPGHGEDTTLKHEKENNYFFN